MNIGILRRKLGRSLVICLAIFITSIGVYRVVTLLYTIESIEVVGSNVKVIIDEKKISKNLLFFPADRVRNEILAHNTLLSDVQFIKKYPHTLVIMPILRPPFARLRSGDRVVLVDRTGVVLLDGDQGLTIPIIIMNLPAVRVGEIIEDSRLQQSLAILEALQKLFTVTSITEYDGPYILVKTEKTDIFIPQLVSVDDILATLQTLMTGFRIKGTLPAVVDLRFDKPVIKF